MSSAEPQGIEKKGPEIVHPADFENTYRDFVTRLHQGIVIYEKKHQDIMESRLVSKMYLVYDGNRSSADQTGGNPEEGLVGRSQYQTTLLKAIGGAIIRDLTANNLRFEWSANDGLGINIKEAFDEILTKAYSYSGTERARVKAYYHAVYSGTIIVQPYTYNASHKLIRRDGSLANIKQGRVVTYRSYDPLRVILDWNADPSDVDGTSDFAIIYIGKYRYSQLKEMFPDSALLPRLKRNPNPGALNGNHSQPVDITPSNTEMAEMGSSSTNTLEMRVEKLRLAASIQPTAGYSVYEYYTKDGFRYTIVNGYGVIDATPNSSGAYGKIPLIVAPLFYDEDTPYGNSLYEMLQQSLEVITTAINQIADTNSITVKSPTFGLKGVLPKGFSLSDTSFHDVVPLDPTPLKLGGTGSISTIDVNKLIGRISFKEVTEGAQFLLSVALDNIWYVTGMNPTSLGGIQDKQIRVEAVANMMSNSSLRSSSVIVKNIETYLMNPLTKSFAQIFSLNYDDFGRIFQEKGLTREVVENIQNHIRVVNGSYLPSDQFNEMQRTEALRQTAMTMMSMDQEAVVKDWLRARGTVNPERYFRDPLMMLTEDQLMKLLELLGARSEEEVSQLLAQLVMRKHDAGNGGQQ